jgi:predicted RNase H-like HicB family nuclease
MKYKVSIQSISEDFSVSAPGLPGCWPHGQTEQEGLKNIKDAIKTYLETVDELT